MKKNKKPDVKKFIPSPHCEAREVDIKELGMMRIRDYDVNKEMILPGTIRVKDATLTFHISESTVIKDFESAIQKACQMNGAMLTSIRFS